MKNTPQHKTICSDLKNMWILMLQSVQQPPLGLFNLLRVWWITHAGFLSVETGQCSPTKKRRRRLSLQIITVKWKKSTTWASRWNAHGAAFRCCLVWENLGSGWGKFLLFSPVEAAVIYRTGGFLRKNPFNQGISLIIAVACQITLLEEEKSDLWTVSI